MPVRYRARAVAGMLLLFLAGITAGSWSGTAGAGCSAGQWAISRAGPRPTTGWRTRAATAARAAPCASRSPRGGTTAGTVDSSSARSKQPTASLGLFSIQNFRWGKAVKYHRTLLKDWGCLNYVQDCENADLGAASRQPQTGKRMTWRMCVSCPYPQTEVRVSSLIHWVRNDISSFISRSVNWWQQLFLSYLSHSVIPLTLWWSFELNSASATLQRTSMSR